VKIACHNSDEQSHTATIHQDALRRVDIEQAAAEQAAARL
jgi:hypothetical protein